MDDIKFDLMNKYQTLQEASVLVGISGRELSEGLLFEPSELFDGMGGLKDFSQLTTGHGSGTQDI
jgi:hypothetical protein